MLSVAGLQLNGLASVANARLGIPSSKLLWAKAEALEWFAQLGLLS